MLPEIKQLLRGCKALIVEDEMLVLFGIENVLTESHCATATAATVDQALALLDGHAFDLAILDVNLNGAPSYEVADALAERGIPYVFSTGYDRPALGGSYGDRPVLTKPYSSKQLLRALTKLLGDQAAATSPSIRQ